MQFAAHFQACIEILEQSFSSATPIDRVLSHYYRCRRYIGSKDKAAISEHVYSVLRNKLCYEKVLQDCELPNNYLHIVAVHVQVQGMDVGSVFTGKQHQPSSLTPEATDKLSRIYANTLQELDDDIQLNLPNWLVPYFQRAFGKDYRQQVKAMNQRAPTDLRVNTLLASVDEVLDKLRKKELDVEKGILSPWALRLNDKIAFSHTTEFKRGEFEVQDEGSQLIALLSGVRPGDRVVDFCAGGGGKTLAMAAMMQNKGRILAMDVHDRRLKNLKQRAQRAQVFNIQIQHLKSERDASLKRQNAKADVVLVDAPCSGTGTWRRNPDSRYHLKEENLSNLIQLQFSILQSAAKLVKPGGRMLYATCSLLKEENEYQIQSFIKENKEFTLGVIVIQSPLRAHLDKVISDAHQLRCAPHTSNTDGFYVCALQRI